MFSCEIDQWKGLLQLGWYTSFYFFYLQAQGLETGCYAISINPSLMGMVTRLMRLHISVLEPGKTGGVKR